MRSTSGMQKTFWEYHQAYDHRMNAWQHEVLFTWQWWVGLGIAIFGWIIWFTVRDRARTGRLLFAGTFVALISLTLDNIGIQLSLWNYLKPVIPAIPGYVPFDFSLLPISVMLVIQYFHKRNPWVIGSFYGILTAFIGESIFKWLGIYDPINWKSIYSIPGYILIYFIAYKIAHMTNFKEF